MLASLGLILLSAGCRSQRTASIWEQPVKGSRQVQATCTVVNNEVVQMVIVDRSQATIATSRSLEFFRLTNGRTLSIDQSYDRDHVTIDDVAYDPGAGRLFLIRLTDANTVVQQLTVEFGVGTPEEIVDRITSPDVPVRKFLDATRAGD